MNINEKIEEIKKRPEHERVRYVWGMVAVSMFFIVIIWVVSLKDNFRSNQQELLPNNPEQEMNLEEALGTIK